MKLGFVFLLYALGGLVTEAQPIENPLRFPTSWFKPPESVAEQVPAKEEAPVAAHVSASETEEQATRSSNSTETYPESSTETSTPAETAASIESEIETGSANPLMTTISAVEPMTTFAYTDEFHPDPFLTAAIKAAKSPIYQRIREPPSQEYNYDFLREM